MLNKNMLIWGAVDSGPHVRINIGYGNGGRTEDSFFGFNIQNSVCKETFGKIDRIPFWDTNGVRVKLIGLFFDGMLGAYRFIYNSTGEVDINLGFFYGESKENGGYLRSRLKAGDNDQDNYEGYFSLGFSWGSQDKTEVLTFDPPPTVIWIPRHSNLSRRLLRRRRSLGGSRC